MKVLKAGLALLLVAAVAVGCQALSVRIKTVRVERAPILLAEQGTDIDRSVMVALVEALAPVAEVAVGAAYPPMGAAVLAAHGVMTLAEKGGDIGAKRSTVEVFEGKLEKLVMTFDAENSGVIQSIELDMAGQEEGE